MKIFPERGTAATPSGAPKAAASDPLALLSLPTELLVAVLQWLVPRDLARVECAARAFHFDHPQQTQSLVEQALRQRAAKRGAMVATALPAGESTWTQILSWLDRLAASPNLHRIAGGKLHSVFIDTHGQLLTCGTAHDSFTGILGHGPSLMTLAVPTPVPSLVGVRVASISAGSSHSLVLNEAGEVLSFGIGRFGRLGHGDEENQHTPKVVEALRGVRIVNISAGAGHSLVLTEAGEVLSFGVRRLGGLLGRGDGEHQHTPKVVEALRGMRIVNIRASLTHNLVLTEAGEVLSFGFGMDGILGHGDEEDQPAPKVVEALRGVRIVNISAGATHSLVLTEAGEVLSFGVGLGGRLGHGDEEVRYAPKVVEALRGIRIVNISAGGSHSLVLNEAGEVLSFGSGRFGGLGHGDEEDQHTPKIVEALRGKRVNTIAAGTSLSICVLQDGRVFDWGNWASSLGLVLAHDPLTPHEYRDLRL